MTDLRPLRWGVLGAARIARALIPAIRQAGGEVSALGVRDPAQARAREFAQTHGVPLVGGYADVLRADVDAVYIPLPNDLHLPWTLRALHAGKHVLTEKPFTLNAAEAEQAVHAARQIGRTLLEAFAYRFQPHITRLQALVQGGALGEVRTLHGAFGFHMTHAADFRWNAAQGGGALYDVGTYPVNLARLLLGEPHAASAQARWTPGGPAAGVDLGLAGVLTYPHATVTVSCGVDWGAPVTQSLSVTGTRAHLTVQGAFHSHTTQPVTLHLSGPNGDRHESFPPFNAYAAMVTHFQEVVRGETPALYPPDDALAQARVLDALYASARAGQTVRVGS